MKGNLNRSDHVILAIVSAFGVYVFLFGYFQLTEYKRSIEIEVPENLSRIEEKKQIDAEINNLLGNVTNELKGTGGKILLYGGVALVGAFLIYRVFRSNPTSA